MGINDEIKTKKEELKELNAKAVTVRKEEKAKALANKAFTVEQLKTENVVIGEILKKIYAYKKMSKAKRIEANILITIKGICTLADEEASGVPEE